MSYISRPNFPYSTWVLLVNSLFLKCLPYKYFPKCIDLNGGCWYFLMTIYYIVEIICYCCHTSMMVVIWYIRSHAEHQMSHHTHALSYIAHIILFTSLIDFSVNLIAFQTGNELWFGIISPSTLPSLPSSSRLMENVSFLFFTFGLFSTNVFLTNFQLSPVE